MSFRGIRGVRSAFATCRDGSFTLGNADRAEFVGELDSSLKHDQRGFAAVHGHRPVRAADRGCRRRCFDRQALAAALGTRPDSAGFEAEQRVFGGADMLDQQRRVPGQPDLSVVGKQHRQMPASIGPQDVARQQ